jgi:hypothetical protein
VRTEYEIKNEIEHQKKMLNRETFNSNTWLERVNIINTLKWCLEERREPAFINMGKSCEPPKNSYDALNPCYKGKVIMQGDTVKITLLSGELLRGYVRFIDSTAIRVKEYIYLWVIPHSIIEDIEVIKG